MAQLNTLASDAILERTFPHPPWPVVPGYVPRRVVIGALLVLAGLFIALYFAQQVAKDLSQLQRERALWFVALDESISEVPATVTRRSESYKWILYLNDLEVSFETPTGTETRTLRFRTLFGAMVQDGPARVRFDTNQPQRWALNWAQRAEARRLLTVAFTAFSGVLLVGGSIAFLGYALWLAADRVRRVALRGVPVACEVTAVVEQKSYGRPTGALIYRFRMPKAFGGKPREAVFRSSSGPLLINNGKALVACILIDRPQVFVVPRQDLFPFAFNEKICRSIQERLHANQHPG